MRIVSYGGGVQSTALLVLAARGELGEVDAAVFANVGEDSEHPAVHTFVREVVAPWCAEQGLPLHEVQRMHDGAPITLLQHVLTRSGGTPIPARGDNGAPLSRDCTTDFKKRVVGKWLTAHGASRKEPADVLIGISTDEIQRVRPAYDKEMPQQRRVYPLIDLGMNRGDCAALVRAALGVDAPRSSCWYCPYHSLAEWRRLREQQPALFDQACALERTLSDREQERSGQRVWLTGAGAKRKRTLLQVIDSEMQQPSLFGEDGCDSGYCMT